jgi:predicted Fe-Mo cluster-binding NifX family protein
VIRVAVASSTGVEVDGHFATAPSFAIHEFDGERWQAAGIRVNTVLACVCELGPGHRDFQPLVGALADCHFVIALQIGPAAAEALFERGIRGQVASGPVAQALREFQISTKFKHPLPKKGRIQP